MLTSLASPPRKRPWFTGYWLILRSGKRTRRTTTAASTKAPHGGSFDFLSSKQTAPYALLVERARRRGLFCTLITSSLDLSIRNWRLMLPIFRCFVRTAILGRLTGRLCLSSRLPSQGPAPLSAWGFAFGAPVLDDVAWSKRSKRVKLPDGFWRNAVARQVFLQGEGKDRNGSAFGSTPTMHRCRGSGKQRSLGNSRRVGFASPSTTHQEAMKYGKKDNEIANRRLRSDECC